MLSTRTVLLTATLLLTTAASAQQAPPPSSTPPPTAKPTSQQAIVDRLFLGFAEEAAIIHRQWWEADLDLQEFDPADFTVLRLVVAVEPLRGLEVGGRVGFGDADTPPQLEGGSGATDLEVWGKYGFGEMGGTDFAAGALIIVPTGDDSAGLGTDAFGFEIFGSARHPLKNMVLAGQVGIRSMGDGKIFGADLDGTTSFQAGGAVIFPLSDVFSLVGEATYASERFEDGDQDTRVLGGVNWRAFGRGLLRGAAGFGLSDGSPDLQLLVGYAMVF